MNTARNIVLALVLIALVVMAACGVINFKAPTNAVDNTPTVSSIEVKLTKIAELQTQIPLQLTERALDAQIAQLEGGSAPTAMPEPTKVLSVTIPNIPNPTPNPTNAVPAWVDVQGDIGPYGCDLGTGNCLTDPKGWLKGRGALKVVFFKKGDTFVFLTAGPWSFHFETLVNQMNSVGVYDVQAFGSLSDVYVGSPVIGFTAQSNGAAILWDNSQNRSNACIAWNESLVTIHKDWNFQNEHCK